MGYIRSVLPYILVFGGFLLPLFTLLKEWKEYENSNLRRAVLIVLCATTLLTLVALREDKREKRQSEQEISDLGQEITGLEGQVKSSNRAQADNTALFLQSLKGLSQKVTDLQTQVTTEALQKKLASVQEELQNTEKALLTPSPKATLAFTFVPFVNPPLGSSLPVVPSIDKTLPTESDGTVRVDFSILNLTDVDAIDGEITLVICDSCKFAKEPAEFTKTAGPPETQRLLSFERILAKVAFHTLSADIAIPQSVGSFQIGILYRCRTCVIPKEISNGTVYVQRGFLRPS